MTTHAPAPPPPAEPPPAEPPPLAPPLPYHYCAVSDRAAYCAVYWHELEFLLCSLCQRIRATRLEPPAVVTRMIGEMASRHFCPSEWDVATKITRMLAENTTVALCNLLYSHEELFNEVITNAFGILATKATDSYKMYQQHDRVYEELRLHMAGGGELQMINHKTMHGHSAVAAVQLAVSGANAALFDPDGNRSESIAIAIASELNADAAADTERAAAAADAERETAASALMMPSTPLSSQLAGSDVAAEDGSYAATNLNGEMVTHCRQLNLLDVVANGGALALGSAMMLALACWVFANADATDDSVDGGDGVTFVSFSLSAIVLSALSLIGFSAFGLCATRRLPASRR